MRGVVVAVWSITRELCALRPAQRSIFRPPAEESFLVGGDRQKSLLHLPEGRVTHERCLGENRILGHRGLKRLEHR